MIKIEKHKIKIGQKVYILGSDKNLYPLTIVSDDSYCNEDNELTETEAYHYQKEGELFVKK